MPQRRQSRTARAWLRLSRERVCSPFCLSSHALCTYTGWIAQAQDGEQVQSAHCSGCCPAYCSLLRIGGDARLVWRGTMPVTLSKKKLRNPFVSAPPQLVVERLLQRAGEQLFHYIIVAAVIQPSTVAALYNNAQHNTRPHSLRLSSASNSSLACTPGPRQLRTRTLRHTQRRNQHLPAAAAQSAVHTAVAHHAERATAAAGCRCCCRHFSVPNESGVRRGSARWTPSSLNSSSSSGVINAREEVHHHNNIFIPATLFFFNFLAVGGTTKISPAGRCCSCCYY